MRHVDLSGRKLLIVGLGAVGAATLHLIERHVAVDRSSITIISADDRNKQIAAERGIRFIRVDLHPENFKALLDKYLSPGGFLLNLSVNVSSHDLILHCHDRGYLYLDTSNESWPAHFQTSADTTTTYTRRQRLLDLRKTLGNGPTALICHGANPGLVSHFAKRAILNLGTCERTSDPFATPATREDWAQLARSLDVRAIHISERDTQSAATPRAVRELVNTWSIPGLAEEASENACFAWGTHERLPSNHVVKELIKDSACNAIELNLRAGYTRASSWIPSIGRFHGFVIPHPEAFSIAELFAIRTGEAVQYQPTVAFCYQPCDDAVASLHDLGADRWKIRHPQRILGDEIISGMDELGVLILRRNSHSCYWFGSQLTIEQARICAPDNNATSLQVAAGVLAGMSAVTASPTLGLIEAEDLPFQPALEIASPYLGRVRGVAGFWESGDQFDVADDTIENDWCFSDLVAE